jgi:hypothetical protein
MKQTLSQKMDGLPIFLLSVRCDILLLLLLTLLGDFLSQEFECQPSHETLSFSDSEKN